jgi:hypothetical protein
MANRTETNYAAVEVVNARNRRERRSAIAVSLLPTIIEASDKTFQDHVDYKRRIVQVAFEFSDLVLLTEDADLGQASE